MKYLHNDPLTADYLRVWRRSANFVRATFFFHYRGTAIQKSLEGLHRGILSQILKQAPQSFLTIRSHLTQTYQAAVRANNLGSLSHDLEALVAFFKVTPNNETLRQLHKVLTCETPLKAFRRMVVQPMLSIGATDSDEDLLHQVYALRDTLLAVRNENMTDKRSGLPALEEVLSGIQKPWTRNQEFISLVRKWLGAIDINLQLINLKNHLMARRSEKWDRVKNVTAQRDKLIKQILSRFLSRKAERSRIETANWNLERLNQTVSLVTNQQLIDLDLCIFIDALDEHDGPPEFVCQLIKKIASNASTCSRTRLKILFSSRPWQPFVDAFGHIPSIQIHEYTENDIRELCLHTIRPDIPGSTEILQLVEEIVNQARGVFLWVKLVLNDLLDNAVRLTTSGIDTVHIYSALMDILKSLPTDLEQYYKTIIERIPHSYRWETFCLLEAVSKSAKPIHLKEMLKILLCANIQDVNDIYPRMLEMDRSDASVYTKEHLRTHSGGLVEIIDADKLQLLHQTLAEFIQLPEFKCIVLGERYRIVKENGYTILSRYEAVRQASYSNGRIEIPVGEIFSHYARGAESTTGNSAYFSFIGVTWIGPPENEAFPKYMYMMEVPYTTLEVALACELKLHLQDTLKHEKETRAVLIFPILVRMIERGIFDTDSAMDFLQAMVSQGLQIHASHFGLLILMDRIYYMDSEATTTAMTIEFFQRVMSVFFDPGANVEVSTNTTRLGITTRHFDELMLSQGDGATIQALHISTHPRLTEYLLDNGADPNGLTSKNLTPLDCWVNSHQRDDTYGSGLSGSRVIIERGGRLNICTGDKWRKALLMTGFRSLGSQFPGWLEGAPGADIDGNQATIPRLPDIDPRQSKVKKWLKTFSRARKGK